MKTVVIPPPGILGLGRSRTVGVIARPLDGIDGFCLVQHFAAQGVPLRVIEDKRHVIHLHALGPVSTADEVRVLAAFGRLTDARLAWHGAVAS